MKSLALFFILTCMELSTIAQTVEGTYSNEWESPSGEAIMYELILHADRTFTFYSTRTFLDSIPNEINEANGTWKLENHLLVLTTDDDKNKLTSNLDMNKAKYISISPRNPNFNLVQPSFKFYESDVFYAKEMELIKVETSVSAIKD